MKRLPARATGRATTPTRPGSDRGSASIWILATGALIVAVAATVVLAGAAMVARHQARTAADMGALAGAAQAELEPASACDVAAVVVAMNRATMRSCRLDGFDVVVVATVAVEGAPAGIGSAEAIARAGPIEADASPGRGSG